MKLNLNIKHYHLKAKVVMFKTLLLLTLNVFSQTNLVPNWSFENYTICPGTTAYPYPPPPPWYVNTNKSGVYLNACSPDPCASVPYNCPKGYNYQPAKTGQAYIGLDYLNSASLQWRQYIQVRLYDSLHSYKYYYVEYFVNLPSPMKYACNNSGLLFTKTAVYVDTAKHPYGVLLATPQIMNYENPIIKDTLGWVKVSSIYKAQGGEQYITLGNFFNASQTNYINVNPTGYNGAGYLIDDVSVIPLDSFCLKADAGKDTTITQGDSVFIGSYTNGLDSVKWFANGTTLIDSIRPGFWVKPTVTTSYVLQQTINGCFSADTVVVNVGAVPLKFTSLTLNPSPKGEGLETHIVWSTANEINVKQFNIQRSINAKDFTTIGTIKANNKASNEYNFTDDKLPTTIDQLTLYYRIESIDKDGKKQYSVTRTLNIKPQTLNNVFIYPNPVKDYIHIIAVKTKRIDIVNAMGRLVYSYKAKADDTVLNIRQLPTGWYCIKIADTQNKLSTQTIFKQ